MVSLLLLVTIFGLWKEQFVKSFLLSVSVIYVFGLLDDARGLSAIPKLIGQFVAGILLITSGISVHFVESLQLSILSPSFMKWFDIAFTLFWLIGITNAMNMIDSMDGLAVGVSALTFLFFLPVTIAAGQVSLTAISLILLGTSVGIYFFNITPAKLFLGDSGAQTLGFIVAVIAMAYTPVGLPPTTSWFVPILLLALPIFDTTLVTVSRFRRKLPIYKANRDHTYHRLVALGVPSLRAVLMIQLAVVIIDCLAFVTLTLSPLAANLIFGAILLGGALLICFLDREFPPKMTDESIY